jgi:hypothetical protein
MAVIITAPDMVVEIVMVIIVIMFMIALMSITDAHKWWAIRLIPSVVEL